MFRPCTYVFIVLALVCALPAQAQQSIEYGSIAGRVLDPSGLAIADAEVIARHVATNIATTTRSDASGRFRLPYLRPGPYELEVHHDGFEDLAQAITLAGGSAFDLALALQLPGVTTNVTVSAAAPVLDTARSQVASTVSLAEVRSLPMNGRNFLELALVAPGISPTNTNSSQLFPETSGVAGVTLSVNSQRNLSNNFIVDGLSANDDAAALSGMVFGVDAIEQVQVVTSGGQAELGRALGGYINVVTRSGSNVRQGEAYYFGRDDVLNARSPLFPTKLPMRQHQYGISAGGPVVSGRTFYFGNVEQRRLDQSGLVTIVPEAAAAVNARLDAVGYAGPRVTTGLYANPMDTLTALAKVTHAATARDQVAVRYSVYDVHADRARGAGGLSAPSAASNLDNRDQTIAVSNTLALTSRTVLESRGQLAHGDLQAPPTDLIGPAVSIAGVAAFGTLSVSPTGRRNTLVQIVNNLSRQSGAHAWRVGADVLSNRDRITFPRSSRGSYTFSSLASFLTGTYNNAGFTQTFGVTDVAQSNPNVGLYAQDEWHARSGLTVNLGVRYDLQWLDTVAIDTNNVSPRLGMAWSPGADQRTVVRASAGLFFDRVPLRAVANALLSAGNTTDLSRLQQVTVSLSPGQAGAPVFPNVLAAVVPSVTLPSLTTIDAHLQNAYSRQASVEVERRVTPRSTVSAGYDYVRGVGLLMAINQNVPSCVAAGGNNGCRPNPAYANNTQYSAAGSSSYHGLHVSWVQQPTRGVHYRVSYSLSKSMNNVGEAFFNGPIDPFDLAKDWGRSDDDQRHRLSVTGAWQLGPWAVSGALQAYSALPVNITSGVTTVQGTPGRPVVNGAFIARNAGAGTPFASLNLRASRAFSLGGHRRLEALIEGFNVTNHRNVVTRNTNFGSGAYPGSPAATFGQVTALGDPASAQVGVRVRF